MNRLGKILLLIGLIFILTGLIIIRKDDILTLFNKYMSPNSISVSLEKNKYYRNYDFELIQNTDDFSPNSYQDILNIYYSVINSGVEDFTFYCSKEYDNCLNDIQEIANDQTLLSNINNYVHPYNSYSHIETQFDSLGKVKIITTKTYNNKEIKEINTEVDKIYNKIVNPNNSIKDNIKIIHDYIINNTKYDTLRSDQNIRKYHSDIAYGPLFEGYAICGGYTDLMQLFLEKLNVKSFRISSSDHVWNAVNIDNTWYHLDLTWDDPVVDDNIDRLNYDFFLIDTKQLQDKEKTKHEFNQDNFRELKETN